MKIAEWYGVLRKNWTVKLICFVLAAFSYYFYTSATLETKELVVPLQISALGAMTQSESVPTHVKITVAARPQDLPKLSEQNISAKLDISYYTAPGTYNVPVEPILPPELLQIDPLEVSVNPGEVKMTLAPKTLRQIAVSADIQGTPASGYEVSEVRILPSTVGVSGAAPLVDAIAVLFTEAVSVDGRSSSFSERIALIRDNGLVGYDDTEVDVSVTIQPITVTRRIVDQAVYLYGVNPAFEAHVDPKMITFTLSGSQNQLQSYVPDLHSVRLDCSTITEPGTYQFPVTVMPPSGAQLVSQSHRTVTVSIVPVEDEVTEIVEETDRGEAGNEGA